MDLNLMIDHIDPNTGKLLRKDRILFKWLNNNMLVDINKNPILYKSL